MYFYQSVLFCFLVVISIDSDSDDDDSSNLSGFTSQVTQSTAITTNFVSGKCVESQYAC